MILGRNVGIMYGGQTVDYETAATATTAIGKIQNFSPTWDNSIRQLRGLGDGRNVSKHLKGVYSVRVNLDWEPSDFTFLRHFVGPLTGAGSSDSDPKTLTEGDDFAFSTSSGVQVFTMVVNKEDGSSDVEDTYIGCVGNSVTLSGNEGGSVSASAEIIARSTSTDTSIANAYTPTTVNPWIYEQGQLYFDSTPTEITEADVASWSITLENNAFVYNGLSRFITTPVSDARVYSFTIVIRAKQAYVDQLDAKFLGDASEPYTPADDSLAELDANLELRLLLKEGDGAGDRKANVWLDQCVLTNRTSAISLGGDVVQVTYNGFAKEGKSNEPIYWVD